jgi:hypothetical protein
VTILLISEGNTDVTAGTHQERQGATRILVAKMLSESIGREIDRSEIEGARLPRRHEAKGYADKVCFACDLYEGRVEAMAIVIDRDGVASRRAELLRGRAQAQLGGTALSYRIAIGVAREMLEAWLVSDTSALATVLDVKGALSDPETYADPKAELARLNETAKLPPADLYDRLAELAGLDAVERRCPSFAEFREDVRRMIIPN